MVSFLEKKIIYNEWVYVSSCFKDNIFYHFDKFLESNNYNLDNYNNSRGFCKKCIKKSPLFLNYVSQNLKDDKDFMKEISLLNTCNFKYASNRLKKDKTFILSDKRLYPIIEYMDETILTNIELLQIIIFEYPSLFKFSLNKENEILNTIAIKGDIKNISYLDESWKLNKELILSSIKNYKLKKNDKVLFHKKLLGNYDFMLNAIKINPKMAIFLDEDMKENKNIITKVIKKTKNERKGYLKYASENLKNDKDFVTYCIQLNIYNFRYIDTKLKSNICFLLDLLDKLEKNDSDEYILKYLSYELRNNIFIVSKFVNFQLENFRYVSDDIKNNFEICYEIIKKSGHYLKFLSDELKDNKILVMKSIETEPYAIKYASETLKDNYEVALHAVSRNAFSIQYVSNRLKKNKYIQKTAIKKNIFAFDLIKNELSLKNKIWIYKIIILNKLNI